MIDQLVETMRLASFRNRLGAMVFSMLAIMPVVLATAGADVGSLMQRIRPSRLWPMKTSSGKTFSHRQAARLSHGRYSGPSFADPCAVAYLPPLLVGNAIVSEGAPGDWIEAAMSKRRTC